jgi:hypothetical protein
MAVDQLFKDFISLLNPKETLVKLVKANGDARNEFITVISSLAAELEEGLTLVEIYLRGARHIETLPEASQYLLSAREKLRTFHSEFKICLGLRTLRDRLHRLFDALPASVDLGKKQEIDRLLYELSKDERMVFDEFDSLWTRVHNAVNSARSVQDLHPLIDDEVAHARRVKKAIADSAREVLDTF